MACTGPGRRAFILSYYHNLDATATENIPTYQPTSTLLPPPTARLSEVDLVSSGFKHRRHEQASADPQYILSCFSMVDHVEVAVSGSSNLSSGLDTRLLALLCSVNSHNISCPSHALSPCSSPPDGIARPVALSPHRAKLFSLRHAQLSAQAVLTFKPVCIHVFFFRFTHDYVACHPSSVRCRLSSYYKYMTSSVSSYLSPLERISARIDAS